MRVTASSEPAEIPPPEMEADGMPAEVAEFVGHILGVARKIVRDETELRPVAFVASQQHKAMIQVMLDFDSAENKQRSAAVVRKLAEDIGADMVVLISEAWQLPDHLVKNFQAVLDRYGSIGACPERVEVVHMQICTHSGDWAGSAPFLDDLADGSRRFGVMRFFGGPDTFSEGVLSGLLPRKSIQ